MIPFIFFASALLIFMVFVLADMISLPDTHDGSFNNDCSDLSNIRIDHTGKIEDPSVKEWNDAVKFLRSGEPGAWEQTK